MQISIYNSICCVFFLCDEENYIYLQLKLHFAKGMFTQLIQKTQFCIKSALNYSTIQLWLYQKSLRFYFTVYVNKMQHHSLFPLSSWQRIRMNG